MYTDRPIYRPGDTVYIRNYPLGFCFLPDIVIERAKSRLGESDYNLVFNNCEHFATWCKTGLGESLQVQTVIPAVKVFNQKDPQQQAQQSLNEALAEIKRVWDELRPLYQAARQEMKSWHQVAIKALQNNRQDLARVALQRKLSYKQQARDLSDQLTQLEQMTENLFRHRHLSV